MSNDLKNVVIATLKIYWKCLLEAAKGVGVNWFVPLIHMVAIVGIFILAATVGRIAGIVGGFIVGMVLALVVSWYLFTVYSAVRHDRVVVKETWDRTIEFFSPVLGGLFMLFILSLVANAALRRPDQFWIKASLNLILAILFNPLPEVLYFFREGVGASFGRSYEFIKENFIEWFMPIVILLLPVAVVRPSAMLEVLLYLSTTHPLRMIEMIIFALGNPAFLIGNIPFVFAALFAIYFLMTFRGLLFEELASSTRRKRIYEQRLSQ